MGDEVANTAGTTETTGSVGAEVANTEAAAEWDGKDWSALDKQPWWTQVPESARKHITEAHDRRSYLDRLFAADDDGLRRDYDTTKAERDALKTERDALQQSLGAIEARTQQEADDREYERITKAYPDIHADVHPEDPNDPASPLQKKGAWVRFCALIDQGYSEEDAAAMARAVMINKPAAAQAAAVAAPAAAVAPPPKTRDVTPPPAIAHAGRGGNNPAATVNAKEAGENVKQRIRRLGKEWQQEENQQP